MERATSNLEAVAQRIRANFSAKDVARESALRNCREIIRHSAAAIRAAHRGDFDESNSCLDAARDYNVPGNYVAGANIAGFVKVVNAMLDQGLV